ncbi:hypothetical protein Bca4012_026307 [Brassica carinata]
MVDGMMGESMMIALGVTKEWLSKGMQATRTEKGMSGSIMVREKETSDMLGIGETRGDGEGSHHKPSRREGARPSDQTGRTRASPGSSRMQQVQNSIREETREEGEITIAGEGHMTPPSQGFQDQLSKLRRMDQRGRITKLQGLVESESALADEDVMEWDEIKATCREHGFDVDAADNLPELSEEEASLVQETDTNVQGTEELLENEEEKGQIAGEETKKPATKKRLFKPTVSSAASNKMRIANVLASPRKRAPTRQGSRNGDNRNQAEGKMASNPTSGHQKP